MTRSTIALILGLATLTLSACASQPDKSDKSAKSVPAAASAEATIHASPAPGTDLAQVVLGMSDEQVRGILGTPSDSNSYMTGKGFIPFYFGPDTHRSDWVYEGKGRVIFSRNRWTGGLKVIRVDADPS